MPREILFLAVAAFVVFPRHAAADTVSLGASGGLRRHSRRYDRRQFQREQHHRRRLSRIKVVDSNVSNISGDVWAAPR